jgi:hypothetical protein
VSPKRRSEACAAPKFTFLGFEVVHKKIGNIGTEKNGIGKNSTIKLSKTETEKSVALSTFKTTQCRSKGFIFGLGVIFSVNTTKY